MKYTVSDIINAVKANNYVLFEHDVNAFNLNLVGVRNLDKKSDKFNDVLCLFYKHNGTWNYFEYAVTTDSGVHYRENPVNRDGTAIVMRGQYRGMWKVGFHKGQYKALVQHRPCTVVRDNNKDVYLDTNIPTFSSSAASTSKGVTTTTYYDSSGAPIFVTQNGLFGINCHKSSRGVTDSIGYYSAGCIVFADNEEFENDFLIKCDSAAKIYGNSFTFTMLEERLL